jgi:hypothetical protein
MDDFAKRVLADRFVGQYVGLSKQRYASHVLQTLFELGAKTVEREVRFPTINSLGFSFRVPSLRYVIIGLTSDWNAYFVQTI